MDFFGFLLDRQTCLYYPACMDTLIDKRKVRDRLLETAARLFYEKGYQGTGINEVIREAGIAKASFYHHFKSKEDLLVTTLEQRHDQVMADVREAISGGRTAGETIARVFEWLGSACACETANRGCPYLNLMGEFREAGTRVREVVRWHKNAFRQLLHELAQAHFRGQNKRDDELEHITDELFLLAEAVFAVSPVHQCSWPAETAFRIANERFKLVH
jgi:AcrR family transcriptional regulator